MHGKYVFRTVAKTVHFFCPCLRCGGRLIFSALSAISLRGTLPSLSPNSTFTLICPSVFLWESNTVVSTCGEWGIWMQLLLFLNLSMLHFFINNAVYISMFLLSIFIQSKEHLGTPKT